MEISRLISITFRFLIDKQSLKYDRVINDGSRDRNTALESFARSFRYFRPFVIDTVKIVTRTFDRIFTVFREINDSKPAR